MEQWDRQLSQKIGLTPLAMEPNIYMPKTVLLLYVDDTLLHCTVLNDRNVVGGNLC